MDSFRSVMSSKVCSHYGVCKYSTTIIYLRLMFEELLQHFLADTEANVHTICSQPNINLLMPLGVHHCKPWLDSRALLCPTQSLLFGAHA